MDELIKILVVDDHNLVRKGLVALLEVKPGVEVVGEASDGDEAVALARRLNPDVILLDLAMPNKDGITALREILQENEAAKVLVLTSFVEDEKVKAALAAGARGYQLKDTTPAELLTAIQAVNQGAFLFNAKVSRQLLQENNDAHKSASDEEDAELTERELMVLKLMAQGYANREIALRLSISNRTATTHVSNILAKMKVENRTQAALKGLRDGLVTLDEEDGS